MSNKRVVVDSGLLPVSTNLVGGRGWALHTILYKEKSPWTNGALESQPLGSPLCLVGTSPTPGVDIPLTLRMELGVVDGSSIQRNTSIRRRGIQWGVAGSSQDNMGTPLTIVTAPPDETPITVSKDNVIFPEQWKKRGRAKWSVAVSTREDVFGYYPSLIPAGEYSTSSGELLDEIQRHLLEPTVDRGRTWTLWTQAQVLGFLNERLSRFLLETGLIRSRSSISATSGVGEYALPANLVELRRVVWQDGSTYSVLTPIDRFQADNATPGWESTPGVPYGYIEDPDTPLEVQLVPTPNTSGTIHLVFVGNHTAIGEVESNLPIPNLFVPAIKYGVMGDMLSCEGEANEPKRAMYCEGRFKEGVDLGKLLLGYQES